MYGNLQKKVTCPSVAAAQEDRLYVVHNTSEQLSLALEACQLM